VNLAGDPLPVTRLGPRSNVADFSVTDRRGRRVPLPDLPGTGANIASPRRVATRRVRESDQRTPAGLPFGAPHLPERTINNRLSGSRAVGTSMRRTAAYGTGGSMQIATARPRDPMWYWRQNNLPFNFTDPVELERIREFCNTPDAPILMADGTSKPLGEITPGDAVQGWKYTLHSNGGLGVHYLPATVLATLSRDDVPVVKLTMASGQVITCTPDHRWFNPWFGRQQVDLRGHPIDTGKITTEYFVANEGDELFGLSSVESGMNAVGRWYTLPHGGPDKVLSVTDAGTATVISMQTSTGNYVAWGYQSKNCRLLYVTHPVIPACIDVYSKLPMQGMAFECQDQQLIDFYSDLFFDQLNFEDFLLDLGTEYWLSGESWALGGWNDTLGVWEADELINPDDVEIEKSLFLNDPRYLMRLPESLRKVLTSRTPHWQYTQLVRQFPELLNYAQEDALMPVSNIILKQLRFKADRFSNRGIPLLMRAFRMIIQEEMLNSALDSIADRLYTPLILTKLGATAQDLGTGTPWIPTQEDMEEFNASLDAALAADFRVLTYHWAIDMQPVFGRENVPDLSNDFDRITERILMVFGLSQTMLTGAQAGETYAADALNRDVVTQLLTHYQRMLAKFVFDRAAIVAEAQEHFDYEVRGGKRYLITEEIYEIDEESGEERIIEQPKLLIPRLTFKTLNISDEETERQFVETLAAAGVPIPYKQRLSTTGIEFNEAIEQRSEEAVALAVAEQDTRRKIFQSLQREGYPIPADLAADFAPKAIEAGSQPSPVYNANDAAVPSLGMGVDDNPVMSPDPEQAMMAEQGDINAPPVGNPALGLPAPMPGQESGPEESDEEREDAPKDNKDGKRPRKKAAKLSKLAGYQPGQRFGISVVTKRHWIAPDNSEEDDPTHYRPTGRFGDPKVYGMRKYLDTSAVPKLAGDTHYGDEEEEEEDV
jgi:hypothetical protein